MPKKRDAVLKTETTTVTNPPDGASDGLHCPRYTVHASGRLRIDDKTRDTLQQTISGALGIPFPSAGLEIMSYLFFALDQSESEHRINRLVEMLVSLKPKDALEAMLAAQMVATHFTSMNCLNRANWSNRHSIWNLSPWLQ